MMKQKVTAVLLSAFIAFSSAGVSGEAASVPGKATWLWDSQAMAADASGTVAFLVSKQVNTVYVQIDQRIPASTYHMFIEKAGSKGIRVYALDGSPDWVDAGDSGRQQLMDWLADYQKTATARQKFSGIHLDVEPYLYSGWTNNRDETVQAYQALLAKAKSNAASLRLPLEVDMPFWFDEISYSNSYGKGWLADWVIRQTDSVTIMAYRDSAAAIRDLVKHEMDTAVKYKKPLEIGVETAFSAEGDYLTFAEEGEAQMNRELDALKRAYTKVGSFGGVAVHSVESWKTMKR
ncbi:amidase [Ectobacillus ponti]|uniref:Amidase n=1 Tax=Ectobacillus ponti TaxID=2961894 RepID=A0AA42BQZ8_9BACI|nr:amidase [Ectobacillus ponti]MCP8968979.1 amidase [Ectobacillus ponti]